MLPPAEHLVPTLAGFRVREGMESMKVMRAQKQLFAASLLLAVVVSAADADNITAKVLGQRVNLRASAATTSEVVGQMSDGEVLQVKSVGEQWVEVVPPEFVEFWVHRDFVNEGRIVGNKVNVRAGPGINYTVVGTLERDTGISSKGSFGEWIRVAPFPEASLWVSKDLVELKYPPKPKVEMSVPTVFVQTASTTVTTTAPLDHVSQTLSPEVEEETAPPPGTSFPSDIALVPLEGQGKSTSYTGIVRPVPYLSRKAGHFRLVRKDGVRLITICYLRGNSAQLRSFEDVNLKMNGREYWAQGIRDPILVIESIQRLPSE